MCVCVCVCGLVYFLSGQLLRDFDHCCIVCLLTVLSNTKSPQNIAIYMK